MPHPCWLDANASPDFLRTHGATMIAAGQGADILDALEALANRRPRVGIDLGILWAESLQAVGRAEEAVARFTAAVDPAGPIDRRWPGASERCTTCAATPSPPTPCSNGHCSGREIAPTMPSAWRGRRQSAGRGATGTRALDDAQRALELATSAGDDKALATAYTMLTMIARVDGDHIAQHRNYACSLEHAERAKDLLQLVRIRCNNGSHLTEDGEFTKALAELDVATRLADLGGYGMFRGLCLTNRAEALIATGRLDEAVADLEAARVIFQQVVADDGCLSARASRRRVHGPWRSRPRRRRIRTRRGDRHVGDGDPSPRAGAHRAGPRPPR